MALDRPRERLQRHGASALKDNELLALVIGHGTAKADALALANQILALAGGAVGLTRLSAEDLQAVPGLGLAMAARVRASVELGRRTLMRGPLLRQQIRSPTDLAELLLPEYGAHPTERFGVVLLDARSRVIRVHLVSTGTADSALAPPGAVFRPAVAAGAASVVLFHNHPSGDATPSSADLELTRRLTDAGAVLGIDVLDHLVLADTTYSSIRATRAHRPGGARWPV